MKKILLTSLATMLALGSFAQSQVSQSVSGKDLYGDAPEKGMIKLNKGLAKTTAVSDTIPFATDAQLNGPFSNIQLDRESPLDSGYLYGTNAAGYKGFAQLYPLRVDAVSPADTTVNVMGVVVRFTGRIQTTSTKNITISVWDRGTGKSPVTNRPGYYIYGLPTSTIATKDVAATDLNVNNAKAIYFSSPLTGINKSVYVGYTINYNWSSLSNDTFGLSSTETAATNFYTIESGSGDTLLSANNIIQDNSGKWLSTLRHLGVGNGGDQMIFPLVRFNCPTCWPSAINGLTSNTLTFFGNYPNPAVNNTNIKFSLKNNTDVMIEVMDVTGRSIFTIQKKNMSSGVNVVTIETAGLAAGNYIYTISTADGSTIASQFSVAR